MDRMLEYNDTKRQQIRSNGFIAGPPEKTDRIHYQRFTCLSSHPNQLKPKNIFLSPTQTEWPSRRHKPQFALIFFIGRHN